MDDHNACFYGGADKPLMAVGWAMTPSSSLDSGMHRQMSLVVLHVGACEVNSKLLVTSGQVE